jgi:aspartate aminotransferase-like enzyme
VFNLPPGLDAGAVVQHMHQQHGTVIAGARNRMQGKLIRIGTLGAVSDSDILTDLMHLELTLRHFGCAIEPGAGVAAAAEVLAAAPKAPASVDA